MTTDRPLPEDVPDPFDAIELAAAHWLARQEFGLSPAETAELERWLAQDFRHARVFAELQQTADVFDRHPEAFAAPARLHVSRLGEPTARVQRPWIKRSAGWVAAAAALAVGSLLIWNSPLNDAREYQLTASTEIGGLRTLALPDGSTVRLNTDSDLTVRFSPGERRRATYPRRGQFHRRQGPRPAVLRRHLGRRRARRRHGIHRPDSGPVPSISWSRKAACGSRTPQRTASCPCEALRPPVTLSRRSDPCCRPANRCSCPWTRPIPAVAAVVTEVAPEQIARTLAWQERRLMFEATPLAEVVAEFNRYIRHRLVIEDATLGAERFGGTFHP
jgi:transmembrane sensor